MQVRLVGGRTDRGRAVACMDLEVIDELGRTPGGLRRPGRLTRVEAENRGP